MNGNLSRSMRENYQTHGVDEYYKLVGSSYRNPHFPGIKQSINTLMNKWWQNERAHTHNSGILICDLAAGSGEVTIALQEWWGLCQSRDTATPSLLQPAVQTAHRPVVARPSVSRPSISQRPVLALQAPFPSINRTYPAPRIVAVDPYTADAYLSRTGLPCTTLSFQDVAQDGLPEPSSLPLAQIIAQEPNNAVVLETYASSNGKVEPETARELYDIVICSFALHLLSSPGALFALLATLSYGARWLVVLEPHKKPEIKDGWGWILWDVSSWKEADTGPGKEGDFVKERVHCRIYRSANV